MGFAVGVGGLSTLACRTSGAPASAGRFRTRGVVLVPEDFTLADWPKRAALAGLTTIGIHHPTSPRAVIAFLQSGPGRHVLEDCRRHGLEVEYELHAMRELLPRDLFAANPAYFRMNEQGVRVADANCCLHSEGGLAEVARNAVQLARVLPSTTGRYFFWGDDGAPWCRCPDCADYTDSEQALLLENAIVRALHAEIDQTAALAHLAYQNTLRAPVSVKPAPGVFLEFAPIKRRYDIPYETQTGPDTDFGLESLDANLKVFPPDTAQVLEYWLDVSRFSGWNRETLAKIPWDAAVVGADVAGYARRGIRHVSTFAAWLDAEYVRRFGEPPLKEYGESLREGARAS